MAFPAQDAAFGRGGQELHFAGRQGKPAVQVVCIQQEVRIADQQRTPAAGQFFCFSGFSQTTDLLQTVYTSGFQLIGHIVPKFSVIMPVALFAFAFFASVFMKNTNQRITGFKPSLPKALLTPCILVWCIMSFAGVSTFLYWNF